MKQLSIRHLDAEKHYVDDWAAYIEKKEMTEEEALEYLRDANSRTDRYAHIVDMDTFEARTADKRADVVFEQIAQTDSGLLSLKNSKGEDCYWYYSALDGFEGLDIVGVIPQSALYRQHNNWPIVWLICGTASISSPSTAVCGRRSRWPRKPAQPRRSSSPRCRTTSAPRSTPCWA